MEHRKQHHGCGIRGADCGAPISPRTVHFKIRLDMVVGAVGISDIGSVTDMVLVVKEVVVAAAVVKGEDERCIQGIMKLIVTGDATRTRKTKETIYVQNLGGDTIGDDDVPTVDRHTNLETRIWTIHAGIREVKSTFVLVVIGKRPRAFSCLNLVEKYKPADLTKVPPEVLATEGKRCVFPFHFNTLGNMTDLTLDDVFDITNEDESTSSSTHKTITELVDALERHRVDIACFQETKWKGSSNREGNGHKLWYSGAKGSGPREIRGDVNGHIEAVAEGYPDVHGGFGYGVRNDEGDLRACKYYTIFLREALLGSVLEPFSSSASALQVLRRLGSIFTSVYGADQKLKKAYKVYKAGKRLLYVKKNKAISLEKGTSKVGIEIQRISLTGFPAQSIGSSNTDVLVPMLVVLTLPGTSQSRHTVSVDEKTRMAGWLYIAFTGSMMSSSISTSSVDFVEYDSIANLQFIWSQTSLTESFDKILKPILRSDLCKQSQLPTGIQFRQKNILNNPFSTRFLYEVN
ncbi:hypothetical protein Tco_0320997 [Tanacetum coccineum]